MDFTDAVIIIGFIILVAYTCMHYVEGFRNEDPDLITEGNHLMFFVRLIGFMYIICLILDLILDSKIMKITLLVC